MSAAVDVLVVDLFIAHKLHKFCILYSQLLYLVCIDKDNDNIMEVYRMAIYYSPSLFIIWIIINTIKLQDPLIHSCLS